VRARLISRDCEAGRSVRKITFHVAERVRGTAGACDRWGGFFWWRGVHALVRGFFSNPSRTNFAGLRSRPLCSGNHFSCRREREGEGAAEGLPGLHSERVPYGALNAGRMRS
jgi:hypothetical protein